MELSKLAKKKLEPFCSPVLAHVLLEIILLKLTAYAAILH